MTDIREPLLQALRHLISAVSSAGLYAQDHQQVVTLRQQAHRQLAEALTIRPEISLMVIDSDLVENGAPLPPMVHITKLVSLLVTRGIGHVQFLQGITEEEISAFALALSGRFSGEIRSTSHIRLGKLEVRFALEGEAKKALLDFSAEEVAGFMELYDDVVRHRKINAAGIAGMVDGLVTVIRDGGLPLMTLAPLREMDDYTYTHSINVCVLNLTQAMSLGIDGAQLQEIGIAGLLHDMGKMFVPPEILRKPGKLTEMEWHLMRQHPVRGARCLIETPKVPRLAAVVAFEHHLKHDLSGYPHVPQGWRQHLASELTALSDFFDALRTRRAYRDSVELRQVAGMILEQRGREFHPLLTRNFLLLVTRMMA